MTSILDRAKQHLDMNQWHYEPAQHGEAIIVSNALGMELRIWAPDSENTLTIARAEREYSTGEEVTLTNPDGGLLGAILDTMIEPLLTAETDAMETELA